MSDQHRLKTLGQLRLESAGREVRALRRKERLLLVYLSRHGAARRAALAELLWGNRGEVSARHSLRQALFAINRELSNVVVVEGDLVRLRADAVELDANAFQNALQHDRFAEAFALWQGEFLPDLEDVAGEALQNWIEAERAGLRTQIEAGLDAFTASAQGKNEWDGLLAAARRWVKQNPWEESAHARLIRALHAAGQVEEAAEHHARAIAWLGNELNDEPSAEFLSLLPAAAAPALPSLSAPPQVLDLNRPTRQPVSKWRGHRALLAGSAVMTLAVLIFAALSSSRSKPPAIAVGAITAIDVPAADPATSALPEMISTQLAHSEGLDVVSRARMQELLAHSEGDLPAARLARATLLLEGELYRSGTHGYRLELRHVDVQSGKVRKTHSIEAADALELAYQTAVAVNRSLGIVAPLSAGIHSVAARALYERGLSTLYRNGDPKGAFGLFAAALAEDSAFAMPAFYAAVTGSSLSPDTLAKYSARAEALAGTASDEERLLINAHVATWYNEPRGLAVAETLAIRYPNNPHGAIQLANARHGHGDFLGAVSEYQRALAIDSAMPEVATELCHACWAYSGIVWSYWSADSIAAAIRTARRWIARRPDSVDPWVALALLLEYGGRYHEGQTVRKRLAELRPELSVLPLPRVHAHLLSGEFPEADHILAVLASDLDAAVMVEALWWQVVSFRNQGRLQEARRTADLYRVAQAKRGNRAYALIPHAIVLQEAGQPGAAASVYDSIAGLQQQLSRPAHRARDRAWWLTHVGDAAAAAGDTTRLMPLADSVQAAGARSGFGRDHRLHHHLRGLLYRARGQLDSAEAEFRAAIFSPTAGYTRSSVELAHTLMQRRRARDAVPLLQAALRGPLDGSALYVTRTELHEVLGRAWDMAGQRDSASHHYAQVVSAWRRADQPLASRRAHVERRLNALREQHGAL